MSCYRICQADLTCTCIQVDKLTMYNIQICDERLKSANHTTPRQMRMCCVVIYPCRVLVLGTFIYPCKYSYYPGFFLQVFVFVTPQFLFCLSED